VRSWVAALGGEVVLYEEDLPACCRRSAGGSGGAEDFECLSCGAIWQAVGTVEPEEDAFAERSERRGAA
jgi:hypothetical protein